MEKSGSIFQTFFAEYKKTPTKLKCLYVLIAGSFPFNSFLASFFCSLGFFVFTANKSLLGGGGVDGAIHKAAGKELLEACRNLKEDSPGCRCPTGQARITPAFNLSVKYVIHTVGPVYEAANKAKSERLLREAYRNSLALASENGLKKIAFPAISCGVYGYPIEEAAKVALLTCEEQAKDVDEIHFVLFDDASKKAYTDFAAKAFSRVK